MGVVEAPPAPALKYGNEGVPVREEDNQPLYKPVFLPVDPAALEFVQGSYLTTETKHYTFKETSCGVVYYSPRYQDDRYIYRHVILTKNVKREAEKIAAQSPDGLLSEEQFIAILGIDLTPGWEHFMRFKGKIRELILRRPLNEEKAGIPAPADEVEHASDDDSPMLPLDYHPHSKDTKKHSITYDDEVGRSAGFTKSTKRNKIC